MSKDKRKAYLMMTGAILILIIGIIAFAYFFFPDNSVLGLSAFIVTLILHVPQIPRALRIGKEKGLSKSRVIFMTIFFGASWWKNVEDGILEK